MSDWRDIIEESRDNFEACLNVDFVQVGAEELGLDSRSCRRMYVSRDAIVVDKMRAKSLNYYGGFEYVKSRMEFAGYVIYEPGDDDDDRVQECIDFYYNSKKEG
jgi:hypothetical protein